MSPEQLVAILADHHMKSSNGHHTCAAKECTWTVITFPQLTPPQHADKNAEALRVAFAKHQAEAITEANPTPEQAA